MSGGITQLVSVGQQDIHIIGKPETTFWRSTFKRHTNFAMGVQRQILQGKPSAGGMSSIRLERKGDLLSYMYLTKSGGGKIKFGATNNEIEFIELYIGGQLIDRQYTDFLFKARHLMANTSAKVLQQGGVVNGANDEEVTFFPFRFFFCEHWNAALPLIALQYHDVEIRIQWGSSVDTSNYYECWANFVYLDDEERADLATRPQEMIVTQLQRTDAPMDRVATLPFNHPVKYLVTSVSDASKNVRIQMNGTDLDEEKPVTPHFNNVPEYYHMAYESRDAFRNVNGPSTAVPGNTYNVEITEDGKLISSSAIANIGNTHILLGPGGETASVTLVEAGGVITPTKVSGADLSHVTFPTGSTLQDTVELDDVRLQRQHQEKFNFFHPFSLDINRHSPNGSVNFSRLDSCRLVSPDSIFTSPIYAVNYNILRIEGGMGGLLYSN